MASIATTKDPFRFLPDRNHLDDLLEPTSIYKIFRSPSKMTEVHPDNRERIVSAIKSLFSS